MAQQHIRQRAQIGGAVGGTGRVGGRVQQQPAGSGRDGRFERGRGQAKAVVFMAGHHHRRAVAGQSHVGVRHPVRRRNDDLVALLQRGGQGVEDRMLGAAGHHHLVRLVVQAVVAQQLVADGLAQGRRTGGHGVARFAALDGRARSLANVRRGIEVGLAHHQVDDVAALAAQFIGAVGRSAAGRWFDAAHAGCDAGTGHGISFDVGRRAQRWCATAGPNVTRSRFGKPRQDRSGDIGRPYDRRQCFANRSQDRDGRCMNHVARKVSGMDR